MLADKLISYIRSQPELALRLALRAVGFETADWQRVVMYRRCFEFITQLNPSTLNVMEISAGPQWVREFNFRFFTDMKYPEYDICAQTLDRQFDLIIADQIFEHLKRPYPGPAANLCDAKTWRPFHGCDAIPYPRTQGADRLQPMD